jgi:hypothetical protein
VVMLSRVFHLLYSICVPTNGHSSRHTRLAIRRMRVNTYVFVPLPAPRLAGLLTKFNSTHVKNLLYSICIIVDVSGWFLFPQSNPVVWVREV